MSQFGCIHIATCVSTSCWSLLLLKPSGVSSVTMSRLITFVAMLVQARAAPCQESAAQPSRQRKPSKPQCLGHRSSFRFVHDEARLVGCGLRVRLRCCSRDFEVCYHSGFVGSSPSANCQYLICSQVEIHAPMLSHHRSDPNCNQLRNLCFPSPRCHVGCPDGLISTRQTAIERQRQHAPLRSPVHV